MAAEIWVVNILKIAFVVAGTHITLTKIIPLVEKYFTLVIANKKVMDALTSLLGVLVLVIAANLVFTFIEAIANPILNYILVAKPLVDLLYQFIGYIQWLILAVFVIGGLKVFKKF